MTQDEINRRLIWLARAAMATYARQWRVVRNDPLERHRAAECLRRAIHMRDVARQWQKQ